MSSSQSTTQVARKVIIVGAGINGLVAAKTYLEINPAIDLTILEKDSTVGGVWSLSRVYAGLVADLPAPAFELSDLRMIDEFGVPKWSDITGDLFHEYLERYSRKFDLLRRCQFDTEVLNVERNGKGWKLNTRTNAIEETLACDVLIMATGNCSTPFMPNIDMSMFKGLILHTKDLHKLHDDLLSDEIKTVAVVGGNKSSLESVRTCAMAGKKVHWLIREDGAGPGMFLNATLSNGKSGQEIGLCRIVEFNVPTIFGFRGWWDWFMLSGKSAWGRKLFDWFFDLVTNKGIGDRYEKSANGRLLKPDICNIFWLPSGVSIAHEADLKFFNVVDEGKLVQVARASVKSMKENSLQLSNGSTVEADAVIFATGWKPAHRGIFDSSLRAELGLPVSLDILTDEERDYWEILDTRADKQVLGIYPILADPPKGHPDRKKQETPWRLLREMIPPKLATTFLAEVSSLWTVAYLEGLLPEENLIGNREAMDKEIALMNAFMKGRYPGRKNVPIAALEIRDWMDVMLKELGVRTDRNRLAWERQHLQEFRWWGWKAWWKEWFTPYEPEVYQGITQEFWDTLRNRVGDDKKAN